MSVDRMKLLRRWRIIWVASVASIIVLHLLFLGCSQNHRWRIGVLPQCHIDHPELIALADRIQQSLSRLATESYTVIPVDDMIRAVGQATTYDTTYLVEFGKRVGLNHLIVLEHGQNIRIRMLDMDNGTTLEFNFSYESGVIPAGIFGSFSGSLENDEDLTVQIALPAALRGDYGRARIHEMCGELNSAEASFHELVIRDSMLTVTMNSLARVLIAQGFKRQNEGDFAEGAYKEAVRILERSIQLDAEHFEAHLLLGKIGVQMDRWNRAEHYLGESLGLNPRNDETYFLLSRLHRSRIKAMGFRNRRSLLMKAIQINPLNEAAWIALGDHHYYKNKPHRAEGVYRDLLTVLPASMDGLLALGKLYTYRNDVLNIVRVYERVIELDPGNADAYYNLGIAYYNDEEIDQAIRFFEHAGAQGHVNSHFYLGVIHAEQGEVDQAIAYFRERIRLRQRPDEPFVEEAKKSLQELLRQSRITDP